MERDELDYRYPYGRNRILSDRSRDEVLPVAYRVKLRRAEFDKDSVSHLMLNWSVLKSPLNWVTILLMLILAGIAGHLVLSVLGIEPATSQS